MLTQQAVHVLAWRRAALGYVGRRGGPARLCVRGLGVARHPLAFVSGQALKHGGVDGIDFDRRARQRGGCHGVPAKTEPCAPVPRLKRGKDKDCDDVPPPPPGCEVESEAWDRAAVARWRISMRSEAAKAIYKQRAAVAECVTRRREIGVPAPTGVRTDQGRQWARLYALAHNLVRIAVLARALIGWGTSARVMCAMPA